MQYTKNEQQKFTGDIMTAPIPTTTAPLEITPFNNLSDITPGHRRKVLQAMLAAGGLGVASGVAIAAGMSPARASQSHNSKGVPMFAYVGSRTTRERNARGEGISVFRIDQDNGRLELVQLVRDLVNPSFLALDKTGAHLYAVHGDMSDISAFKVDRATGQLEFLNRQSTGGKNPVHLAIAASGRHVVVSNHLGSSLAVLPIGVDGSLGELEQLVTLEGPLGPHRVEQKLAKPHFNPFDPSGRFVIVQDKGLDRTFSFRFDNGKLTPADPPFVVSREGAGPRHMAFAPRRGMAYVLNELDSTVTAYAYSDRSGALVPKQILSTLPDTFTGNSRASEIQVDAAQNVLYASNRGHDSIAVFHIDPATGLLKFAGAEASQGKTPRFFTLTPNGRFMFVLNEDSDSIVAFAVDTHGGRLKPTGFSVPSGSPVCMVFSTTA
jgi:6-phosphogluconolactonase (cycloisomerase 2 family)